MASSLNVYGISKYRDEATIQHFLNEYVDRVASEDRSDEELMLLPLDNPMESSRVEDFEWEPAQTLTYILKRGLQVPRRAFTVYLLSSKKDIDQVILSFTSDNQVIFGLSINDEEMSSKNEERSRKLLQTLIKHFKCHAGIVAVECPPPLNESDLVSKSSQKTTIDFVL
jgi:hypothetical protein